MIVLDAYAVIAYLRDEPAASLVGPLLAEHPDAAVSVLGVAEVLDYLVRLAGADEDSAALDVAQLGLADPQPLTTDLAIRAGLLRARRYHRRECAISLADRVAAETARAAAAPLVSSDAHLLQTCHHEGIPFIALPDRHGNTWAPLPPTDGPAS